jgi:hypothetical protein
MRSTLFRQEAVDAARDTLVGRTLAAHRLPFALLAAFAAAIALAIAAFATWGHYTRKVQVRGYLAPAQGPAEAHALAATLRVPLRDVGLIAPGDTVFLRYDAFPHQRFGSFDGRVSEIAGVMPAPGAADGPGAPNEPAYRVTVRLASQIVRAGRAEVPLQPGMALEAELRLERRRLVEWLLEPVLATASKD